MTRRLFAHALHAAMLALVLGAAPLTAQQRPAADSTPADSAAPAGAAVMSGRDTLFVLTERLGPFSPRERADGVRRRLRRLAAGGDSIVVAPGETADELLVGDSVLMTVTDADARAAGRPRTELAREWAGLLAGSLRRSSLLGVIQTVALGTLWTLLATAVLWIALLLLNRLFPRLYAALRHGRTTWMPAIRLQRFELLSADRLTELALGAAGILRLAVIVVLLYVYVPLVLRFFPWTQPLSRSIFGYVTTPLAGAWNAFLDYLPNVFTIGVIVVVAHFALRLIHKLFGAIERGALALPNFEPEWAEPTYKIVRFLVLAFVVVVLFPYLPGSDSAAFKGVSLFLGVLFSIGSSSAIANIVAGVVLTYTRAFSVGDRVAIGETTGDVLAKTLLVTRVRTPKNVDVTIPNGMVLATHVQNFTAMARTGGVLLHTAVTIGYDVPWRQVHELLIAAARATPNILGTPAPFVLQTALDDFYVRYELNAATDQPAAIPRTYSALHENIQDRFHAAGVEIMSPHYRAERDGSAPAIPPLPAHAAAEG